MSLPEIDHQLSFFDTAQVCSRVLAHAGSHRFKLFSEHVWPALMKVRPKLEEMYCATNGRPAEEPIRMLGVLILQYMERLPDRQAAEACTFDLRWKHALNIPVDENAFHATSLVKFRNRLMEHGLETLGFDAVLDAMRNAGYLRKRTKQRIDSTHIVGLVKHMSSLENLRETIRLTLEQLSREKDLSVPTDWNIWWERYVENRFDYRATKPELIKKNVLAGQDILSVLRWAESLELSDASIGKVALLRRVFNENFVEQEGVAERIVTRAPGAVINPHDPQAQWCKKDSICTKNKEWVGYKAHIAESVEPPVEHKKEPTRAVLTAVVTVKATASDKTGIQEVEKAIGSKKDLQAETLFVDAGYTSAAEIKRIESEGRQLRGPVQPAPCKKGRYSANDFEIDTTKRSAVCPSGKSNTQCSHLESKSGVISYRYEWSTHCQACPQRGQCVPKGQKHRTVTVGGNHNILQARRREMQTDDFKKEMHSRNGIEATISELVRGFGFRRSRYRGLQKTEMQNLLVGAACNLKRWSNRMEWEERLEKAA